MTDSTSLDEDDSRALESFNEVLSFYGVELQSHAAIILGLALLVFAVAQVWGQILTAGKLTWYDAPLFSTLVALMVSGMVYQSLRLYTYGKLASALLNVDVSGFNKSRDEWNKKHPGEPWKTMLPYRKVSMYSAWVFRRYAKPWLTLKVLTPSGQGARPNFLFLATAFEAAFTVSYGLIFGGFDWSLLLYVLVFAMLVLLSYYVLWRRLMKRWLIRQLQSVAYRRNSSETPVLYNA